MGSSRGGMQCGLGAMAVALLYVSMVVGGAANISDQFSSWQGAPAVQYTSDGVGVTLSLSSQGSGAAGAGTKEGWLYGSFGAWVKLPGGNAAGVVATLYMSSPTPNQCEYDFEFLGHEAGKPRKIHTNVFVDGEGGREQQIYMPGDFDPTASYHYYSFEWHKDMVVFYVNWKPIRMFKNLVGTVSNFTYCDHKAMGLYLSIWDGSNWATEGGSIPMSATAAPWECQYSNFILDGCKMNSTDPTACQADAHATGPGVTPAQIEYMKNIRNNASLVKYNYCDDPGRYPNGMPECQYNAM